MKNYYQNKAILITGATSGIGKDLAIYLAQFKTKLALIGRRENLLREVQSECEKQGGEVQIFSADVTDFDAMQKIKDELLAKWGFVDIVVANAGVGGLNPGHNFSYDINRKVFEINYFGQANTMMPFVPSMIEKKKGQLVGISSLAAFRGLPNAASYSSSKAAQARFLESMRVDLRKYNIAVSSIHPGFVVSEMTKHTEFRMPFMVPVRKSTILIAKAIKRKKSVYLYPWQMRFLTYINKSLPNCIYDRLVPKLTKQKSDLKPQIF